jgi:predicted transcriptional regulator
MEDTITITLPSDLKIALDDFTQAEGISPDRIITKAIEDYIFIHKFRTLRSHLIKKAPITYTDEEIFEMIS